MTKLSTSLMAVLFVFSATHAANAGPVSSAEYTFAQARTVVSYFLNQVTFSRDERKWFALSAEALDKVVNYDGTDRDSALALLNELEHYTSCFMQVTDNKQFNSHMGKLYLLVVDSAEKQQKLKRFHEMLQIPGIRTAAPSHC